MRGEYPSTSGGGISFQELPPRARRIHHGVAVDRDPGGTTSACAENTFGSTGFSRTGRNYLRVRGEYSSSPSRANGMPELPPRARRIPVSLIKRLLDYGTTSACAENTFTGLLNGLREGNYLRVRGEYPIAHNRSPAAWELPPRARRIPSGAVVGVCHGGTTSACAENTAEQAPNPNQTRNYLRVRGEYPFSSTLIFEIVELPPRARRILVIGNIIA